MGTYLGCPTEVDKRTTSTLNQIHDRVLQCISSWKYSFLSTAARSILINSVSVTLAGHIISIYLLPQKAMRSIVSCAKALKSGCGMKVGNGRSTSIQEEVGAGKEPVTFRNRANRSHSEKPKLVLDIVEGQSWNANKIWSLFE
ncbi:hypothetical protein RDABS01_007514 [Bienertia sinuspersici]